MAYQSKDLSVLAYVNGFTLWHYITEDRIDRRNYPGTKGDFLFDPNYFNPAQTHLRKGDFIMINCASGNTMLVVTSNEAGVVTVGFPITE